MNFKDQLAKDLEVFINPNEFAETVDIDNQQMDVVIDNDLLKEHNLKGAGEGLAVGELLFHVKMSYFPEPPVIEDTMRFNRVLYRISDVQESLGMYTITLVGYQS